MALVRGEGGADGVDRALPKAARAPVPVPWLLGAAGLLRGGRRGARTVLLALRLGPTPGPEGRLRQQGAQLGRLLARQGHPLGSAMDKKKEGSRVGSGPGGRPDQRQGRVGEEHKGPEERLGPGKARWHRGCLPHLLKQLWPECLAGSPGVAPAGSALLAAGSCSAAGRHAEIQRHVTACTKPVALVGMSDRSQQMKAAAARAPCSPVASTGWMSTITSASSVVMLLVRPALGPAEPLRRGRTANASGSIDWLRASRWGLHSPWPSRAPSIGAGSTGHWGGER